MLAFSTSTKTHQHLFLS
uniref:Uncharacterized protein n=1 Tax=Anguilla anguilla TaxID=7936 RepID=A0A0E9Q3N8_ANGAN